MILVRHAELCPNIIRIELTLRFILALEIFLDLPEHLIVGLQTLVMDIAIKLFDFDWAFRALLLFYRLIPIDWHLIQDKTFIACLHQSKPVRTLPAKRLKLFLFLFGHALSETLLWLLDEALG